MCDHFFCVDCIPRYLETMMKEGRFPAFCPQCREDATEKGEAQPRFGAIEESGLSFLQQKGVISKDFMMRFVMQMRRSAGEDNDKRTFFKCPAADCTYYILEEPVEYMIIAYGKGYKKVVQLGQCACGAHVCPICKKEQPEQLKACTEAAWKLEGMKGKEILAQLPEHCTVVRAYKPPASSQSKRCLQILIGEELVLMVEKDMWCYGFDKNGKEGWFPRANVRMRSKDGNVATVRFPIVMRAMKTTQLQRLIFHISTPMPRTPLTQTAPLSSLRKTTVATKASPKWQPLTSVRYAYNGRRLATRFCRQSPCSRLQNGNHSMPEPTLCFEKPRSCDLDTGITEPWSRSSSRG